MIVDMASSGFAHLSLIVFLEAGHEEVRRSWESVGLAEGHEFGSDYHYHDFAGFRKGGQNYRVYAHLSVSPEDGSSMSLNYDSMEVPTRKEWRANLDKIGRLLDHLAVPCFVIPSADGQFSSDRFKPMLDLPLLRFNMPREFFDEIRGIRLAKIRDGFESDSVTLDINEEGTFNLHAQTIYTTTSSSDIPSAALSRLVELRDRAVTEIQVDIPEET